MANPMNPKSSVEGKPMQRQDAIACFQAHRDDLAALGVKTLFLFGSVARNQATINSDVDLLVEFSRPVGLLTFARLHRFLETWLDRPVDLGTPDSLKDHLRSSVSQDLVHAFSID